MELLHCPGGTVWSAVFSQSDSANDEIPNTTCRSQPSRKRGMLDTERGLQSSPSRFFDPNALSMTTRTRVMRPAFREVTRLEQFFFEGFGDCAGSGMDMKFAVDVSQVRIYCMITQSELIGYLFLDQTLSH